jgi:hypothetical protein
MVVKHKKVIHRHPAISRIRKELDKIENDIAEKTADKVMHEMRESRKTERKEHRKVHRRKR